MPTKIKKTPTRRKVATKSVKPVAPKTSRMRQDIDDGLAYGGAAVFFASVLLFLGAGFIGYNLFLLTL